jgi:hypothetical protein
MSEQTVSRLRDRIEQAWQRQLAAERDVEFYRGHRRWLEQELRREQQHQARLAAVDGALRKVG